MAELIERRMACGHVERRTAMGWALRDGLVEKCEACILADARGRTEESFRGQIVEEKKMKPAKLIGFCLLALMLMGGPLFLLGCDRSRSIAPTVLNQDDAVGWKAEVQGHFSTLRSGKNTLVVITAPDGQKWLYILGSEGRSGLAPMK